MSNNNLILNAIYEYLREHGHICHLYFSARIGNPPLICGVPCISVLRKLEFDVDKKMYAYETRDIVGIRMCGDGLLKAFTISSRKPILVVEVSNPNLFDVLDATIVYQYPTREN